MPEILAAPAQAPLSPVPLAQDESPVPLGPWRTLWRRLKRNRTALLALWFIVFMICCAICAPLLAPHPFDVQFRGAELKPPLTRMEVEKTGEQFFLLGTDQNARDTFSRMIYGTRVSLAVGIVSSLIGLAIGMLVGVLSGFYSGWVDAVLMRITDTIFAFPSVLLAVAITATRGEPSLGVVFLALGIVGWTGLARIVRSQVLSIKTLDYIAAARSLGTSNTRILFQHILPNCFGNIVAVLTLSVGGNILGEAGLSFLGLGVQEPYPSWGAMLAEARDSYRQAWWMGVFPGLAIVLTVLAFNLLGDGIRDAMDRKST